MINLFQNLVFLLFFLHTYIPPEEHCKISFSFFHFSISSFQNKCPDEQLPPLKNLPDLSPGYKDLINRICNDVMQTRVPPSRELSGRDNLMKELIQFVRQIYPTATLTVFGSSVNGFSFSKSDLDISLTFTDHETGDDLPAILIIENLAEKLTAKQGLINLLIIGKSLLESWRTTFLSD